MGMFTETATTRFNVHSRRMWAAIGCFAVVFFLGFVSTSCDPIRRRLLPTAEEVDMFLDKIKCPESLKPTWKSNLLSIGNMDISKAEERLQRDFRKSTFGSDPIGRYRQLYKICLEARIEKLVPGLTLDEA